jgi:hypothetical protein
MRNNLSSRLAENEQLLLVASQNKEQLIDHIASQTKEILDHGCTD